MKRSLILAAAIGLLFVSPASAQLSVGAGLGAHIGVGTNVGVQANANTNANLDTRESRRQAQRHYRRKHDRDDWRASGSLAAQTRLHARPYRVYGESQTRSSVEVPH